MSPTKEDRNLQSAHGSGILDDPAPEQALRLAHVIANALRQDFGQGPVATKTVADLVNANHRAAKNWFAGHNSPSGELLIRLMAHSDCVFETVLRLARREHLLRAKDIDDAMHAIREVRDMLGRLPP